VPLARTSHCKAVAVQASTAILSPSCIAVDTSSHEQASQEVKLPTEAVQNSSQIDLAETRARKVVRIDEAAPIVIEITPYAEIYGIHPREFVFDKHYFMVPANGFNEMAAACRRESRDEEDSDSDVEDCVSGSEWCIEYCI